MSNFLTRLAQRQLGQVASVEPRVPELYASVTAATPLPVIEDIPAEISESRPMNRAPALVASSNATRGSAAAVANTGHEEGPIEMVIPTQQSAPKPGEEHVSPRAVKNVGAEGPPQLAPEPTTPGHKLDLSLPAQPQTGQPASLSARPEARVSQVFSTRDAPPPRLVDAGAATPVAAPPRLERATPNRGEAVALEREHRDFEPPVHVTIGRIEVTAAAAAPAPRRAAVPRKPAMSLDEYLARCQRRES